MAKRRPTVEELLNYARRVIRDLYGPNRPKKLIIELEDGESFSVPIPPYRRRIMKSKPMAEPKTSNTHSPDFASINWRGAVYKFTKTQRIVVKELWEAFERGTPELSQEYLLEKAESNSTKLADLFQTNPAWGSVIVPGESRGSFQLAE